MSDQDAPSALRGRKAASHLDPFGLFRAQIRNSGESFGTIRVPERCRFDLPIISTRPLLVRALVSLGRLTSDFTTSPESHLYQICHIEPDIRQVSV